MKQRRFAEKQLFPHELSSITVLEGGIDAGGAPPGVEHPQAVDELNISW